MPDSAIRTTRGAGGPRSLKVVHFEQRQAEDGSYVVEGLGGTIRGAGRTPDLALEAAQQHQLEVMTSDTLGGTGFRQVTAEQLGIEKP
jgi:hypothetical protein